MDLLNHTGYRAFDSAAGLGSRNEASSILHRLTAGDFLRLMSRQRFANASEPALQTLAGGVIARTNPNRKRLAIPGMRKALLTQAGEQVDQADPMMARSGLDAAARAGIRIMRMNQANDQADLADRAANDPNEQNAEAAKGVSFIQSLQSSPYSDMIAASGAMDQHTQTNTAVQQQRDASRMNLGSVLGSLAQIYGLYTGGVNAGKGGSGADVVKSWF